MTQPAALFVYLEIAKLFNSPQFVMWDKIMNINPWQYTDSRSHLHMNNPFIVFFIMIHYFGEGPARGAIPGCSIRVVSNYALVPLSSHTLKEHPGTVLTQIRPRQNNSQQATSET